MKDVLCDNRKNKISLIRIFYSTLTGSSIMTINRICAADLVVLIMKDK